MVVGMSRRHKHPNRAWMPRSMSLMRSFNVRDLANPNSVWQHSRLKGKINDDDLMNQVIQHAQDTPFANVTP